jgi:hypothetical protein
MGGSGMYKKKDRAQTNFIDEFMLPFGGHLDSGNRWVKISKLMPWDFIEDKYADEFKNENPDGRKPIPARVAFGAIYIKEQENLTDEKTLIFIAENPYAQMFLGYNEFVTEPLFERSMMSVFRHRFPSDIVNEVNDEIHKRNSTPPEPPKDGDSNSGTLILDATVAPADIRFPNDVSLLNECRENVEKAIEFCWDKTPKHTGHMLPYNKKRARSHYLSYAKRKKQGKRNMYKFIRKQLNYVMMALARLDELLSITGAMLKQQMIERIDVIREIARQQQKMLDERKRTVDNRIVSVRQPHVRPIVRGKVRTPVEFGQKLTLSIVGGYAFVGKQSFNNFNEGITLIECAQNFFNKFGFWPKAILADQIYRTKGNRAFCKEHGIRLSGPPLGRKKSGSEEAEREIAYADSCERNIVESRNGIAKRKYGLDLIMCTNEENAKTEAVLNILAMNIAHLLRALSCLFEKYAYFCILHGI